MITDPTGDLFTRIRNAVMAKKPEIPVPYSRLKEAVAQVLLKEGYLSSVTHVKDELVMTLTIKRRKSVITGIKNVSRPGLRIYRGSDKLPRPLRGAGISIISTPKGVMSNKEARKLGVGGEVLGEIW
ncbi:MAG: 30S ribosomal protein S8 [bacterium]|nr:30S ribosomal protein S8 [bacterium]